MNAEVGFNVAKEEVLRILTKYTFADMKGKPLYVELGAVKEIKKMELLKPSKKKK